ncbi:hypothetical protein KPH14_008593 [Odynerus spinipes]|uniref:phospholipase A2 n=1 Tax=Odynerus spinipes TaxID=1348599 RepID=A0AAD9VS69_9HYME|nr:hypothetical protein KPH14_008593 [Odynerus spinipes]
MLEVSTILVLFLFVGYVPINFVYGTVLKKPRFYPAVYNTATTLISSTRPPTVRGTLWCGKDIIAKSYNNLGSAEKTDKCCRQWHNCDEFIPAKGSKYDLQNEANYKVLLCNCNKAFYDCLINVEGIEASIATEIMFAYFKLINPKCLQKLYYYKSCFTSYYDEEGNQYSDNFDFKYFCPKLLYHPWKIVLT